MSNIRNINFSNVSHCDNTALDELSKVGDLFISLSEVGERVAWLPCEGIDIAIDFNHTGIDNTGTIDSQIMALRIVERLVNAVDGSNPGTDFMTNATRREIVSRLENLETLIASVRMGYLSGSGGGEGSDPSPSGSDVY